MAFKIGALKLPFGARGETKRAPARPASVPDAAARASWLSRPLPLIGRLSTGRQLQILTVGLVALLLADAGIVAYDTRQGTFATIYVATVGKIRMLSQRLAKAAQQASQGNREAFKQLRESRDEFAGSVKLLLVGGVAAGVDMPASPPGVRSQLTVLDREWKKTEKNAGLVIGEERNLLALGEAVRQINANNPQLLELADEIAALSVQAGGTVRQNAVTSQLVMLTQRMAKNANTMLAGDVVDPEVAFLLGKDTNTFRDTLQGLLQGNETMRIARVADADMRAKLVELESGFKQYQRAVADILGNMQRLVNAKRATRDIFNESEALLRAADALDAGYDAEVATRQVNYWALAAVSGLALLLLLLVGKVYISDSGNRAEESERQNRANQQAILRLLDEMDVLKRGDLTVRAKVTEDVTGAIADAINSTIEELRRLVTGINSAAQQVTSATAEAQSISGQLLQAAQKQASEIQGTGQSVAEMTVSMHQVSKSAGDSASVAKTSLAAAEKGSQAVQNAIRGMNDIREQIQETSKRIKRLGESSQEIGEIVQLISDITEQTNVLALNAAIQAASAGEAGRGFTVVAEEVQRLAERSGEATRHISAIVKSIQRDTQDAVEAMERSTKGVVDGTRTADEAGDALRDIEQISTKLAELIGAISNSTQQHAGAAAKVAANMKAILAITQLTTEGTKKTAASSARLTALAEGLKSSVSNFKVV
jgi:twitching motility protein PilJ